MGSLFFTDPLMRKLIPVFIILFAVSCKGQGEKWVRYIADSAGNPVDTMNITIYENEIVLEAVGGWNWTRRDSAPHDDIFKYEILDQLHLPSDPRKTMYRVKADNDCELNFSIYRAERGRAAVNFGELTYSPSVKCKTEHGQFEKAAAVEALEEMNWQSPWFYSDSLAEHLKSLRGFASVNSDTVLWYFQTRLDYVKQNKARFERWGTPGYNYIYEEPGMAAMEAKGYNPWRVYSQMMSCCYNPNDSAYAEINEEYNALLNSIK
jgi:hypothetical protein